jgi:leucyl-tRNA synthetase
MAEIPTYDPQSIELSWQGRWQAADAWKVRDDLPRERCYYVLEMFPYPSGKLHMGHVRNYTIGDAVARYKRMCGFHVLHPVGFDAFGLPAEQAAIERKLHPKTWTYDNIAYMRKQLQRMGFSYDWSRQVITCDPDYAAHEQRLFLDLVERGLVYRKSSIVNWSTGLNTVLANEQVVDGRCWRTGAPVIQKELPQWFLRTTAYTPELLADIDTLTQWPDAVRTMQRNWIGRSEGADIDFAVVGDVATKITVFTTRPDTVFGVTFLSLAPEHPLVDHLTTAAQREAVADFRASLAGQSAEERTGENAPKRGVPLGSSVINPATGVAVPLWIANFVLAEYGTGAVMAVPAHDTRDFAFASAHGLPIRRVIAEDGVDPAAPLTAAFTEVGTLLASGPFDGQRSDAAKSAITAWLASNGHGRSRITYRYRDWTLSRQRYWGNPIPFVYGDESGAVPVAPQDLPVALPDDVTFDGLGNPLAKHPTFASTDRNGQPLTVDGPRGKEPARRETDTMDTFMQSSWYFARYACPDATVPLDPKRVDHWLPVDLYIGGIEHACMHLLYARFFQKALCDAGHSTVREPFKRLLCQGMVVKETFYREDANGKKTYFYADDVDMRSDDRGRVTAATLRSDSQPVTVGRIEKMSKSKNNGVDPQAIIDRFGADTARLFILFAAPPEKELVWDDAGVLGAHRYLKRLWTLVHEQAAALAPGQPVHSGRGADASSDADRAFIRKIHETVRRATGAMEQDFAFNTAIAACMELTNTCDPKTLAPAVVKLGVSTLLRILAPMAPHIASELWTRLDTRSLDEAGWPSYDEAELVADRIEYPVQIAGKIRSRITLPSSLDAAALETTVREHPEVIAALGGKPIRKLIAVPGKIINIIIG